MLRKYTRNILGILFSAIVLFASAGIPIYLGVFNMITPDNAYWLILIPCIGVILVVGLALYGYWQEIIHRLKKGKGVKALMIIGFVFVAIGIIGIGMIAHQVILDRNAKSDTYTEGQFLNLSDKGIENTIGEWLFQLKYTVSKKDVPVGVYFQYDAIDEFHHGVTIARVKDDSERIRVTANVLYTDAEMAIIKPKQAQLFNRWNLELSKSGVVYSFGVNRPINLSVYLQIDDSLTKSKLLDSTLLVIRTMETIRAITNEVVPELTQSSP